jgi:flagellar motility protein MotE (MotC chaperone)
MSQSWLKSLIIAKLVIMSFAIALYQGWLTVGDVAILAEEPAKEEPAKKDEKAAAGSDAAAVDGEKKEEDPATKERRSFLSDLFEMPKLDPKSARKEEVGKYLDLAERKERQLKEREAMLVRREAQLKDIEQSIDVKLVKLDEERKFIAKTLQDEKDLKGERVEKLITLFDKMEPKKAAPQMEKLDKDLVVAMFKGLKQKQVTTILEFMNPEKSVELTEYFGRVKSGREYDLLKELNSSMKKEFADCKGMPIDKKSAEVTPAKMPVTTDAKGPETASLVPAADAKKDEPEEATATK